MGKGEGGRWGNPLRASKSKKTLGQELLGAMLQRRDGVLKMNFAY